MLWGQAMDTFVSVSNLGGQSLWSQNNKITWVAIFVCTSLDSIQSQRMILFMDWKNKGISFFFIVKDRNILGQKLKFYFGALNEKVVPRPYLLWNVGAYTILGVHWLWKFYG